MILIQNATDTYIKYIKTENENWIMFESKIGEPKIFEAPHESIPFKR